MNALSLALGEAVRRRDFITLFGGVAVGWPLATRAQDAGRTYRLGMLFPYPRDLPSMLLFFDELRARGFIEGKNLMVDYRDFAQRGDLVSEYAEELAKAQMSCMSAAARQFARRKRRRKRFRSSELQTIWSERDWWTR